MARELHSKKGIRTITGGLKEFNYTQKDLERIENTDTHSTKEFKEKLKEFYIKNILYRWNKKIEHHDDFNNHKPSNNNLFKYIFAFLAIGIILLWLNSGHTLLTQAPRFVSKLNCSEGYQDLNVGKCVKIRYCSDGTKFSSCSKTKPLYCDGGLLLERANLCGCPDLTSFDGKTCIKIEDKYQIKQNIEKGIQNIRDFFGEVINNIGIELDLLSNQISTQTDSLTQNIKETVNTEQNVVSYSGINDAWVHEFISIVNEERKQAGFGSLEEHDGLDSIAVDRFRKMMEQPFITHYGADEYNVGEVIFYPDGTTPQEEIGNIKSQAPLHWDLLMDSRFSSYGYHIENGPTIEIWGSCSTTELPGPNIDVKEFFKEHGCTTSVGNKMWFVIDMK